MPSAKWRLTALAALVAALNAIAAALTPPVATIPVKSTATAAKAFYNKLKKKVADATHLNAAWNAWDTARDPDAPEPPAPAPDGQNGANPAPAPKAFRIQCKAILCTFNKESWTLDNWDATWQAFLLWVPSVPLLTHWSATCEECPDKAGRVHLHCYLEFSKTSARLATALFRFWNFRLSTVIIYVPHFN